MGSPVDDKVSLAIDTACASEQDDLIPYGVAGADSYLGTGGVIQEMIEDWLRQVPRVALTEALRD